MFLPVRFVAATKKQNNPEENLTFPHVCCVDRAHNSDPRLSPLIAGLICMGQR